MCCSCDLQSLALQKSSPMSQASRYAPCSSSSISSSIARIRWARVSFGPGGDRGDEVVVVVVGAVVVVALVAGVVVVLMVVFSWAVLGIWL